jgi:hypothetical protein
LLIVVIAAVAASGGFAFAQSQSGGPSGSPAEWSQADWIAHDPALDPASWEDARYVPVECLPQQDGGKCWQAVGLPKLNHDAPTPWPMRRLWCEDTLSPSESATDPLCDAEAIPEGYRPETRAELNAYGVDRVFGAPGQR